MLKPRKKLWPMQNPMQKSLTHAKNTFDTRNHVKVMPTQNVDPCKKYFDPCNTRNPRIHLIHVTMQPTWFSTLFSKLALSKFRKFIYYFFNIARVRQTC